MSGISVKKGRPALTLADKAQPFTIRIHPTKAKLLHEATQQFGSQRKALEAMLVAYKDKVICN